MGNLIKEDRARLLAKFSAPYFRRVGKVAIGEPSESYKGRVHAELKKQKQVKLHAEWKTKKLEFDRKMVTKKRQKETAAKQRELAKKKKEEEQAKKKKEDEAKKIKKEEEEAQLKAEEEARIKV